MKHKIFTKISNISGGNSFLPLKKEADSVKKASVTEEFERCVMCGDLTCVPISMPVDWREDYEIGIGQLCIECKRKLQKVTEK